MKKLLLTLGAVAIAATAFATNYRKTGDPLTPAQVLALPAETKVIVRTHSLGNFGWWKAITTNEETGEGYFIHRDTSLPETQEIFPEDFVYTVTVVDGKLLIKNSKGRYLPKASTKNNNATFSSNVTSSDDAELLYFITSPAIESTSSCYGMYVFRAASTASNASTHSDLHFDNAGNYCVPKYFQTADAGLQQPSDNINKTVGASLFYLADEMPEPEFAGAKLVTRDSYTTDLVAGAVIALQCKDTAGGLNYFFNGPAAKSTTLGYEQLYQIEAAPNNNSGYILKRLSNNKYVGKNGGSQNEVDAKGSAAVFTMAPASLSGWTSKPNAITPANAPTIRFTAGGQYLNTQNSGGTPCYTGGTGGYSGWFVYTFSPEQVEQIRGQYEYTSNDLNSGLINKKIQISNIPATTLTPGWYALYNVNRNGYVKQEGGNLYMRPAFSENGVGVSEEIAPYLFYVAPNPYHYYDGEKLSIQSAYGSYFGLVSGGIKMSSYAPEMECALIGNSSDIFYIRDLTSGYIADGNQTGTGDDNTFVGYGTTIPAIANSNNAYQFFPVTFRKESESVVNYTVNLRHNERVLSSAQYSHLPSTKVFVGTPNFFNDYITINVPRQNNEVFNIDLQLLSLPFRHTETTDNMIWQAVNIKPGLNNKDYVWTYNLNPSNPNELVTSAEETATNGFTDEQLWAFVGNMADGFKIYNKAAGMNKWLYKNEANAIVGDSETNCLWKPRPAKDGYAATDTYCGFSLKGQTDHINLQASNTELKFWWDNDQGSTMKFIAPSEPMLATAANFQFLGEGETYTGPRNAVGAILINGDLDLSYGPGVIAAATADKYDLAAADALRDLIARYNANVTINQLEPNGFYRIQSTLFANQYLFTHKTDGNIYSTTMSETDYRTNYHSIFKFEPVPNKAGQYYLLSQGKYIGETYSGHAPVQVEDNATRGEYDLVKMNHDDNSNVPTCAAFALRDNLHNDANASEQAAVQNHFHQGASAGSANRQITAWGRGAHGSHFYIEKAEDIEIDLGCGELNGMHIGFGYFPFPITTTDEKTQFFTIHESNDKQTNEPVLTYAAIDNSVPAYTPVMIGNPDLRTITLAIGSAAPANARRRVIEEDGTIKPVEGTQDTDTWKPNSWTKVSNDPDSVPVPEGIAALGVTVANVRFMTRTITLTDGGDLSVDFMYTRGNERVDICGVVLFDSEYNIVASDCHIGYSGTNKTNKVYNLKVPQAGTYTLRYYISNEDGRMDTNGNIFIDFVNKDKSTFLVGHLREKQVAQGDYIVGTTRSRAAGSLGFVKLTEDSPVQGNYISLPASNLYHPDLANVTELPLVDRATTTDIQEIVGSQQNIGVDVVYDLQGRRLAAPVKGFNIINGRKVFLR